MITQSTNTLYLWLTDTQIVKNPVAIQETWFQSLGEEDLLEKGMTSQSSVLAWRIPWTEKPGGIWSMGLQRVGHN